MASPMAKADLLVGYALAIGAMAVLQAVIATAFAVWVCGLQVAGPLPLLVAVAVVDGLLGTALGLGVSAFARTEFQAVQFMPAILFPQFLLCGLLVPRERMPDFLQAVSDVLPLSYAVDAMTAVTTSAAPGGDVARDVAVVLAFVVAVLTAGALTLRRQTP